MLKEIFKKQKELDARLLLELEDYNPHEGEHIKNKLLALWDEMGELNHELKPLYGYWKRKQKPINKQRVLSEIVDIIHFLVSILQSFGFTEDDLYNEYMNKNKENHERKNNNY